MKGRVSMLMKIGDVVNQFGISHRSLHYWENVGILRSSRGENGYRFYDEENLRRIKQIVLLRKLRLSIPAIQEIFTSNELAKVIAIFTAHLDDTKRERDQLNALGIVLTQLIHMLKDKKNMESVYQYLDRAHTVEMGDLKTAFQLVLSEPDQKITVCEPKAPILDMTGVDLSLAPMTVEEVPEVTEIVKQCYAETEDIEGLLQFFDFQRQLQMPDCTCYYKIMQSNQCVGAINVAYVGMEAMLIRNIAYIEPENTIYIFELLKQQYPNVLCWMMFDAGDKINQYSYPDCEMKKRQFWEDNGFEFYTNANSRNQYIKMMKPHDEVYTSSRYRFAILDGSMDRVSFRMCAMTGVDFYDNWMGNWRITDSAFVDALIYDTGMERGKIYSSNLENCEFRYTTLANSTFTGGSFKDCTITNCIIDGLTIDGINVEKALEFYKKHAGDEEESDGECPVE